MNGLDSANPYYPPGQENINNFEENDIDVTDLAREMFDLPLGMSDSLIPDHMLEAAQRELQNAYDYSEVL